MKNLLLSALFLIVALAGTTYSSSCDYQLLPELSFNLAGHELNWPSQSTKNIYESTGRYIPRNVIATRVQIYKDEALIAMPRYKSGVPFTLGMIDLRSTNCSPRITPFPCSLIQEEGNCAALQSAVDLVLDVQNVLWILDVGIVNTLEQPVRRCPPKVVGIDAKTGKVVKVVDLGKLIGMHSRLQYLVVDYAEDDRVFLYISDSGSRAIIVYNVTADFGYRIVLPKVVNHGCPRKDVLYLALVRKSSDNPVLYFTYLGSSRLFKVDVCNLRQGKADGTIVQVGRNRNKIVLLGTDNGCAIFFRYKGQSDVYMWNTKTAFKPENFLLVQKGNECRLPTQVMPGYKRLMWVIESNFHDYILNTLNCSGASMKLHPLVKSYKN